MGDEGGFTPTCPPIQGSDAVDQATSSPLASDQRGVSRPAGAADIGAAEWTPADGTVLPQAGAIGVSRRPLLMWTGAPGAESYEVFIGVTGGIPDLIGTTMEKHLTAPTLEASTSYEWRVDSIVGGVRVSGPVFSFITREDLFVDTTGDVSDPNDGLTTLREAIAAADAADGWDRVGFAPVMSGATITLTGDSIEIPGQELAIDAAGLSERVGVAGNNLYNLLELGFGSRVGLTNLNLALTDTSLSAASIAVYQGSSLTTSHCGIDGGNQKGIRIADGRVELRDSSLSNNRVGCDLAGTGEVWMERCVIAGNTYGISAATGTSVTLLECVVSGQTYQGLFLSSAAAVIDRTTFSGNAGDAVQRFNYTSPKTFTITATTFSGNSGVSIYNYASDRVIIEDCDFLNNTNTAVNGPCRIRRSRFTGNQSFGNGAAVNSADADIAECFFSNNTSDATGGAVYLGGGSLTNSTFTGNTAETGGAIGTAAGAVLRHLTVTGNRATEGGGGVHLATGAQELSGCLIAGNIAPEAPDVLRYIQSPPNPPIVRNGPNLIGVNQGVEGFFAASAASGVPNADGDFVGDLIHPLDPMLSPVGDYGGPTRSCLPLAGSLAIDRVSAAPATDQRGMARPQGAAADIGAIEMDASLTAFFPQDGESGVSVDSRLEWLMGDGSGPFAVWLGTAPENLTQVGLSETGSFLTDLDPGTIYYWQIIPATGPAGPLQSFTTRAHLLVTTELDVVDVLDGESSLREAVAAANSAPGGDHIVFAPALAGSVLSLSSTLEIQGQELTIDASAMMERLDLSGGNAVRLILVENGGKLRLRHIRLAGGAAAEGAAILARGHAVLRLEDCGLTQNTSTGNGGAVAMQSSSSLTAIDSLFSGNSAVSGGAVHLKEATGSLELQGCQFLGNTASSLGGALGIDSVSFAADPVVPIHIDGCEFVSNQSTSHGGAIWLEELTDMTLGNCWFDGNIAGSSGGAIYFNDAWTLDDWKPTMGLTASTFSNNRAGSVGGAIYATSANFNALNVTFSGNHANTYGSAAAWTSAAVSLRHCTVAGNTCNSSGGALYGNNLTLRGTVVAKNTPDEDIELSSGTSVFSEGGNLIGNNKSVTSMFPLPAVAGEANANGDHVGSSTAPLDPLLTSLEDNGGPAPTHLALSGSPMFDRLASDYPASDQRGVARPQGAAADIEAAEVEGDSVFFAPDGEGGLPVNTRIEWLFRIDADAYEVFLGTSPESLALIGTSTIGRFDPGPLAYGTRYYWRVDALVDGTRFAGPLLFFDTRPLIVVDTALATIDAGDGLTSLPEAVLQAASQPGLDEIRFAPGLSGQQIVLASTLAITGQELVIDASAPAAAPIVSGGGNLLISQIGSSKVSIKRLNFVAGSGTTAGAISVSGSELDLTDCVFSDHLKSAVVSSATKLNVWDCDFLRNQGGTADGGAIRAATGTLLVSGSHFESNHARYGGALYATNISSSKIDGCTFVSNQATHGGATYHGGGSGMIGDSLFSANRATQNGGASYMVSSSLIINRCCYIGNQANGTGGGCHTSSGAPVIANTTFADNQGNSSGGACYCPGTSLFHCTITGNRSFGQGGGLNGGGTLINSIVAGNTASSGTDIYQSITFKGRNIVGSNHSLFGSSTAAGKPNSSGHFIGTDGAPVNPGLAPVGAYGGQLQSRPPLPGSFAIENGSSSTMNLPAETLLKASDQLNLPKPLEANPDIGAREARPIPSQDMIDTDSDGIDDRLEPAYGLVVGIDDSARDSDGDGRTDANELREMTQPHNAADVFRITGITKAAGFDPILHPAFVVTWKSFPGLTYEISASSDLQDLKPVVGSRTTATGYATSREILLPSGRGFAAASVVDETTEN